jgi:nucleoside-diphosphate-sugar epimerase
VAQSLIKILLTGSTGFIGAACRRAIDARRYQVLAPSSAECELFDEAVVRDYLLRHRPTHLLHTAWRAVHGDIMHSPQNLAWQEASLSLVKAFQEAGGVRAACIGSSAEYDWSGGGICRIGRTPLRPATVYGSAKHALHLAARELAASTGLSLVWPRVFDLYGPGDHPSRLGATVLRSVLSGAPVELTHGRQVRDYMYVTDVAEGITAALLSGYEGETDIASGVPHTVRELATEIARQAGREDLLLFGARTPSANDPPVVMGDGSHARAAIQWGPRFTLQQGVAGLVAWGRNTFIADMASGNT